jgi:hypothetical protein
LADLRSIRYLKARLGGCLWLRYTIAGSSRRQTYQIAEQAGLLLSIRSQASFAHTSFW